MITKKFSARIIGTGSYVPKKIMTNHDFERLVDTSDEWITTRTGIKQRHITGKRESTADQATEAARQALDAAGVRADQLDMIIVATITPEMFFPSTACFVGRNLGAPGTAAFDLAAACSGFVYGVSVAGHFIETGAMRTALVIGAESLSKITDYTDRTSCILFGDAAGAAVLQASDDLDSGLLYSTLGADGRQWKCMHIPGGGSRHPATHETVDARMHYMKIYGREVYRFAVNKMQELVADCMAKCNLSVDQVKLVIPHQVNRRIIESAVSKLGFPPEKVYVNIDRFGNTSAASIPLALDQAIRAGEVQAGDNLIFVAFGGGLTWAGAVMRL
jgi:3-oxoacyl-[acyl-carrier-protein] synthase-3